jgi:hypothetical protein
MTIIRIHTQDHYKALLAKQPVFQTSWDLPRTMTFTYSTNATGEAAAEEAFHIFNAPYDSLQGWQKLIVKGYHGASISVGDIVEVDEVEYLCASIGWKTR